MGAGGAVLSMRESLEQEAATVKSMTVLTKSGVMKFDLGSGVGSRRPLSASHPDLADGESRGHMQRLQRQVGPPRCSLGHPDGNGEAS
eukprot:839771-Prorocentrum_minimum.AAC.2